MEIWVTDKDEAPEAQKANKVTHVLTLLDPFESMVYHPDHTCEIKRLSMFDIESDDYPGGPTVELVQEIIDFGKSLDKDTTRLLVHCYAGVSRSTAAALVILYMMYKRDIRQAMLKLKEIRPRAAPNTLICSIADSLLKTKNGELLKAAEYLTNNKKSHYDDVLNRAITAASQRKLFK